MQRITIDRFDGGMADDRFGGGAGEASTVRHFDVLTHPRRLQPRRGMSLDTASTGIGNIIVASDGKMYAVGLDPNNPTLGKLYVRAAYGGGSAYATISTMNQLSGAAVNYDFLLEWPDSGATRSLLWASANVLVASQLDGAAAGSTQTTALTYTSIGQGLVHPKDKSVYFPYKVSTTPYIALIAPNGTIFAGLSATAFALPLLYRAYCLSYYGNYLAIPLTSLNGFSVNSSIVALWNRDVTTTTFDETIPWGEGDLKVLNNLGGVLIGISESQRIYQGSVQDFDSIVIKAWAGGAEPTVIKEIKAMHILGNSGAPSCSINPRVNFIKNNRLYFSINVTPGDGKQPTLTGVWSVGRSKLTGQWTVVQEILANNTASDTGVIAAAMAGDYVSIAHTTEGTLTYTTNGTDYTAFGATSIYESVVNPQMPEDEKTLKKKLFNVSVRCLPLLAGSSLVLEYRVDSDGATTDWVTVRTYTTTGGLGFDSGGFIFKEGYNYEFRLKSVGGARVTSYSYKCTEVSTNA